LKRGEIPDALGREEEWLQQRLAGRGKLVKPLLRPTADGRWMHFYEIGTPSGCLVMARLDVTELVLKSLALERNNEQLEHLSTTDGLTGLANRRLFDQCLQSEWQRSTRSQQPLSLLLIDIDHFKRYNDHYGHLAGDACLRQMAGILYDCAQRSGELVARYGGEEFALLLPGANAEHASVVAQRCMDELANAKIIHANSPVSPWLTCSIGVATVVATQDQVPESLVRYADEALYRVKSAGRARFYVASV
jgi:diguanylate cyclase (GGDEF)-like protein